MEIRYRIIFERGIKEFIWTSCRFAKCPGSDNAHNNVRSKWLDQMRRGGRVGQCAPCGVPIRCTAGPVCGAQSKMPSVSVCDAARPVYTIDGQTDCFSRPCKFLRHSPVRQNCRWVARRENSFLRDALKVITTRALVITGITSCKESL